MLFLDTGYHFAETIGTRDAVEAVYDVNMVNVTPEQTVAEQDASTARTCSPATPTCAAALRKVEPLSDALCGATTPG